MQSLITFQEVVVNFERDLLEHIANLLWSTDNARHSICVSFCA